ncbi:MAG: endoglycosylceramidase [Thermoleophilaceae bacterium]|nr:endoglycosylceramidase [Thermoleophilaceae bacterium]
MAAIAVGALWVAAPADAAQGFLTAPGGPFFGDAQGRRVELHGANLVPKCGSDTRPAKAPGTPCLPGGDRGQPDYTLSPSATDPGRRFTARDAATLRRLGFSVVRLGIVWSGLEPGPKGAKADDPRYCTRHTPGTPFASLGVADPYRQADVDAYLRRVDRTVKLLAREHIRVLVDMHQDGWGRPFDNPGSDTPWMSEGAAAWATCTDDFPFNQPATWQGAYTDPAVNSALTHFWSNDVSANLQGQFIRVWKAVARHYAENPAVIGYDVFNEPSAPTALTGPEFDRQLACFYAGSAHAAASCGGTVPPSQAPPDGVVPEIQKVAPRQIVFYEAPILTDFGGTTTLGIVEQLPFPRLALSYHVYGGVPASGSFQCDQPSCGPQEQQSFDNFREERGQTMTKQPGGPAWLLTEFGAEDYVPDVARVAALADERLASWTYWAALQLHDPTGSPTEGLIDERTRRPDPGRSAVLARPYPLATAGTPTSQSFDPASEAFDLAYDRDPAVKAPTRIGVPLAFHYAKGYDVTVTGAHVTSRPDSSLLTLVNAAGAGQVTVHVRRRTALRPGSCLKRRHVRFGVRARKGERLRRLTVYRNGRRARVLRHPDPKRVVVKLGRDPRDRLRVKVVVRSRGAHHARRRVVRRTYRPC